ncbi:MAG: replication restart helicase PriA [Treponema sp.]
MKYLDIALNIPLNQPFTYSTDGLSDGVKIEKGMRAEIRFGNRKTTGFVTEIYDFLPEKCESYKEKMRPVIRILDEEPLLPPELMKTAVWLSQYYLCSVGEALFAMAPSGRREAKGFSFPFEADFESGTECRLSDEQLAAAESIAAPAENSSGAYHYLYGATGTGKTEVFLHAAEKVLRDGKGVIYLVPEIGLTKQVIDSVVKRFGDAAAVLHSGLTAGKRLAEWKKILHKKARIVVGARSAVFAPVPDLGLIIIDEEHDASYKSGNTPRYHARQTAMFRAARLGIPLVMGSATPSVEAWHLMREGTLIRHTLTKRLSGGAMPSIETVDLSKSAGSSSISERLADETRRAIAEKRQVIFFLNRRGFTHFFRCSSCGFEMMCRNCSVPMTYHKSENRLRCHYCGWTAESPSSCPQCGSLDAGYSGFGTEFIEAETRAKFPNARILRIDADNIKNSGDLQEKLSAFKNGDYDIMLGTQMVAKGLNFPRLKLVGVISADTALHLPDFRAAERTFALITQVAGRAGRYFPDGKVIVQTYAPEREAVKFACEGKTAEFYGYELSQRRLLDFPPYSRLVRLVFRAAKQKASAQAAFDAAKILSSALGKKGSVIGPAECPVFKISRNFRYHVILKSRDIRVIRAAAAALLTDYTRSHSVYIECDIDPLALL